MILFNLVCADDHQFEGWFRDGATYDAQAAAGEIACPVCGNRAVRKAPMAPSVLKGKGGPKQEGGEDRATSLQQAIAELRNHVEANFDYVGEHFAEEVLRMHHGEAEKRSVYGEASLTEARSLLDEGIDVLPLPGAPRQDA
jgi:hypothetical protein